MSNAIKSVYLHYLLSEEGRRNSLREGGDGCEVQRVEVPGSDPLWERALSVATVDEDGYAHLEVGYVGHGMVELLKRYPELKNREFTAGWSARVYQSTPVRVHHRFDAPQTAQSLLDYCEREQTSVVEQPPTTP